MRQNILIYRWNYDSEPALLSNLKELGYHCVEFCEQYQDSHNDAAFVMKLINCIREEDIRIVFSWNYFPLLAMVCEMQKLPYISWICDCPSCALASKTVLYPHNYLFCFDSILAQRLEALGCDHVYHFPLAVDVNALEKSIQLCERCPDEYIADISFVGDFCFEEKKWLEIEGIPEYVKGYIAGIEEAQLRVYGYNFVQEMLDSETARDIQRRAGLLAGDIYFDNPRQIVADLINQDITEKERIQVISKLSGRHQIHLYTASYHGGNDNIKLCGTIDYQRDMPLIFRGSKINLNICSRTIEAGIPQRVLDILACGGFCISNYQPEIAEFFEDGKEIVMYTDMDDLAKKAEWYLQHDEERTAIARAGHNKVKEQFSMKDGLADIMKIVEERA